MKIAAIVILAVLGFVGYHAYERSGKMSAARLEAYLDKKASLWQSPVHMQCRRDPAGKWDYICTETVSGLLWGYDVNRDRITGGGSRGRLGD